MVLIDVLTFDEPVEKRVFALPRPLQYAAYYAMLVATVKFGTSTDAFFYFQF
jgi:hypothetical protein